MKLESIVLAAVLATSTSAALSAPIPMVNTTPNFWTAPYSSTPVMGEFWDTFTFTLAGNDAPLGTMAFSSFSNIEVNGAGHITFLDANLNGNAYAFSTITTTPIPGFTMSINSGVLPPVITDGVLSLLVHGISDGGSYAGTLNLSTQPVPEPATYGMMLAGLGLIGLLARRRRDRS